MTACDLYQQFVGEMGISRQEFLYEIRFWEARRIIRGYKMRHVLHYQMQRMNIWASMFCMGNKNNVKPNDIIKLYFDDDEDETPPITEAEAAELQAMMAEMNRKAKRKKKR